MKKGFVFIIIAMFLFAGAGMAGAAEKAPQKVVALASGALTKLSTDPVIVKAVREENARGKTLAQIREKDKEWMKTPGIDGYMKALMESDCGKHLRSIQQSAPYYAEIFVMDNQGANVAMTDKTSDYWQGDEDKFKESYKGGAGAVHISDVAFDDSTQAYLVQVSVPVRDGDKVIGVITIGIDVDKVE